MEKSHTDKNAGKKSAEGLEREAHKREEEIEDAKGSPQKKGDERFEDFEKRADGKK